MAGIPHDQVHPDTLAAIAADIAKLKPICCSCWNKRHPHNPVNTGGPVHGTVQVCQDCGGLTSANVIDEENAS